MRDELLRRVRAVFEVLDPVPAEVVATGRAAYGTWVPGAVPAEAVADLRAGAAGLRAGTRLLRFAGPGVAVEVEVSGRDLAGRLEPPARAEVTVRHANGETRAECDGFFEVHGVPEGLTSLVFRLGDGSAVVTGWVRL